MLLTVCKLLKKFGKNYDTIPESWLIFEVHRSAILSSRFELQDNGGMRPAMVEISRASCETITMAMFLSQHTYRILLAARSWTFPCLQLHSYLPDFGQWRSQEPYIVRNTSRCIHCHHWSSSFGGICSRHFGGTSYCKTSIAKRLITKFFQ